MRSAHFYRGKQISVVIGTSAGNDYDFRGRLIARHMGRHIPANLRSSRATCRVPAASMPQTGLRQSHRATAQASHVMTKMMGRSAIGTQGVTSITASSVDRQHHQFAQRHQFVAYERHHQHRTNQDARTRARRAGRNRRRGLRNRAECTGRHQAQDRYRLSGRQ